MKSINYKWYKKGYRYPLFEVNKNSIIEKNEEGVKEKDFSNLAFYYSPFEQFYHRNDPDNLNELEEITEESKVILWNKFSNNTHKTNDNNTARDKKSNKNTNSNIEKDFEKSFNLVINNIYPIPVNNNLNIDFSVNQHSEIIFSIINANSKILYKNKQVFHPGNYNNKIAVDFLIDGYYILRIQCKDEITEIKIIKNSLI